MSHGRLLALNPDGRQKWAFDAGSDLLSDSLAIGLDGTVYVLSGQGLHAISPEGTQKWLFPLRTAHPMCTPAIGTDGTIYIGIHDPDGFNLHAINPDGAEKWRFYTDGDAYRPVLGPDDIIYIGCGYGSQNLYAFNPDGSEKWRLALGGRTMPQAIADDGTIYARSQTDISSPAYLCAINPDATEKWRFTTGGGVWSLALGSDGTIYLTSDYLISRHRFHKLHALSPDGIEKWAFMPTTKEATIYTPPVVDGEGTIYVASDNVLYALNPDGSLKWDFSYTTTFGGSDVLVLGADKTLYVSSKKVERWGECVLSSRYDLYVIGEGSASEASTQSALPPLVFVLIALGLLVIAGGSVAYIRRRRKRPAPSG